MTRAGQVASTILRAEQLDRDWMRKGTQTPEERKLYTSWMPFPLYAYLELLAEAFAHLARMSEGPPEDLDPAALEIGGGPGSRVMLARDIYGLNVRAIERDDEMAAAGRSLGLDIETADALGWKGYGDYELIWFNRPMRDPGLQAELEAQVWDDMAPGTVVMCANLESPPPSWQFFPVLDDWEIRRGIYMKLTAP